MGKTNKRGRLGVGGEKRSVGRDGVGKQRRGKTGKRVTASNHNMI